MSNSSPVHDLASPRQIEVLVVQSNPADTLLTIEAFHAAGLTTGLSCVTEGKDALSYVRGEVIRSCSPPRPHFFGFVTAKSIRVGRLEGY